MDRQLDLRQISQPDDPELEEVAALLAATFADPNTVLGLERIQEFLAANCPDAPRCFFVITARDPKMDSLVGATVFSYVPAANCGFSEYIVAAKTVRGTGAGRLLFDERKSVLDSHARMHGHAGCRGLFIEVEHPDRTPTEVLAAERLTAVDEQERLRIFHHFGFRRVEVSYVQPPLAAEKDPVDYLDLMFLPWDEQARATSRIPADWILDTVEVIWMSWSPLTYLPQFDILRNTVPEEVALLPIFDSANAARPMAHDGSA